METTPDTENIPTHLPPPPAGQRHCRCRTCSGIFAARFPWPYCPKCDAERIDRAEAEAQREAQEARSREFWAAIPPLYRETDPERLAPALREIVSGYQFGPRGVGFVGAAGAGKTRAAVLILAALAEQGMSTLFLPATEFAAAARVALADRGPDREEAAKTLSRARKCKALLLDDLGKCRFTDRAEAELYEILEYRVGHLLPTFWTSNSDAKGLREMLSADRADAMIRRLGREFCQHVTL